MTAFVRTVPEIDRQFVVFAAHISESSITSKLKWCCGAIPAFEASAVAASAKAALPEASAPPSATARVRAALPEARASAESTSAALPRSTGTSYIRKTALPEASAVIAVPSYPSFHRVYKPLITYKSYTCADNSVARRQFSERRRLKQ